MARFLVAALVALATLAPAADAGGLGDLITEKVVKDIVKEGSKTFQAVIKERAKTRRDLDKNASRLEEARVKAEEKLGVSRLKEEARVTQARVKLEERVGVAEIDSATDVKIAEMKLEAERFKLQVALAKTRSSYRSDLLRAKVAAVEAALESVDKRRVELGLPEKGPATVVIDGASAATPAAALAPVVPTPADPAVPALSARDLRALRLAHMSKDTYTPEEAQVRGFVVVSGGALMELTAVEVGGATRYWVSTEHLGR